MRVFASSVCRITPRLVLLGAALLGCLSCGAPPEAPQAKELRRTVATLIGGKPEERIAAANRLGILGGDAAVTALVEALDDHANAVRLAAANALERLAPSTAVAGLARRLAADDPHVRKACADALGAIADPDAVDALDAVLGDEDAVVRLAAAHGLARQGAEGAARLQCAVASGDPRACAAAATVLADAEMPQAASVLLGLLADPDPALRIAAADGLGRLRASEAVPALAALLTEPLAPAARPPAVAEPDPARAAELRQRLAERMGDAFAALDEAEVAKRIAAEHQRQAVEAVARQAGAVRRAAGDALVALGADGGWAALLAASGGKDRDLRALVVGLLRRHGVAARAALVAALLDRARPATQRRVALEVVARLPDLDQVAVLRGLLADPDQGLRRDAVRAFRHRAEPALVDDLVAALSAADGGLRADIARTLGGIAGAPAGAALITLLADAEAEVRRAAAEACARRRDPAAAEALLRLAAGDADGAVRAQALRALGRIGEARAAALARPLLACDPADRGASDLALAAAQALGDLRDAGSVPELLACLAKGRHFYVRHAAAAALCRIGDGRAAAPLAATLAVRDNYMADIGMRALGEIRAPEATAALCGFLGHADLDLRKLAAKALVEHGAVAVPALVALLDHEDPDRRGAASQVLAAIGPEAVAPLLVVLAEGGERAIPMACHALAVIGDPRGFAAAVALLGHRLPEARIAGAWLLGQYADPRALEPLRAATDGAADPAFRRAIQAAIERIQSLALGPAEPDPETRPAVSRANHPARP